MSGLPIRRIELAALAAPSLPLVAISMVVYNFLPDYYATKHGVSLPLIGTLLTIIRLIDIAVDPFLGGMMDRLGGLRT